MARKPKQYEATDDQPVDSAGGGIKRNPAASILPAEKSPGQSDTGSGVSGTKKADAHKSTVDEAVTGRSANKLSLKKRPGEKPFPIIRKPVPISKSGPLKAPRPGSSDKEHPILTRKVESGSLRQNVGQNTGQDDVQNKRPAQPAGKNHLDKQSNPASDTAGKAESVSTVEQQASELDFLDLDDGASWVSGSEAPSDLTTATPVPESSLARWTRMGALVAILLGTAGLCYLLLPQWIERRSNLDSQVAAESSPASVPGAVDTVDKSNDNTAGVSEAAPAVVPRIVPRISDTPGDEDIAASDEPDASDNNFGPVTDNDDPSLPLNVRFRNKLERLNSLVDNGNHIGAAGLLANMDRTLYGYGAPEFGTLESQILQETGAGSLAELTRDLSSAETLSRQAGSVVGSDSADEQLASTRLAEQLEALRTAQNEQAGTGSENAEPVDASETLNLPADPSQQARLPQQSRVDEEQAALITAQEQAARDLEAQQAELRLAEEQAAAQLLAEEQAALELAQRQAEELRAQEQAAQEQAAFELAQRQAEELRVQEQAAREQAEREQAEREQAEREQAEQELAAQELAREQAAQRQAEEAEARAERELAVRQEEQRLAEERESLRLAGELAAQELAQQRVIPSSQSNSENSDSAADLAQEQAEVELASQRETQRIAAEQAVRELARQQSRDTTIALAEPPVVNSIQSVEPGAGSRTLPQPITDTISDQERQLIYERFGRLQKAIRDRDIEEVIALTDRSVAKIQQFQQMFQNNVSIDARIKNVSIRDADGEIQGTLVITRLERADGLVTGPPLNLASVTLTSRRNEDGWSLISW